MEPITLSCAVKEYLKDRFLEHKDFRINMDGARFIMLYMGAGTVIQALGIVDRSTIFIVTPDGAYDESHIFLHAYDPELFEKLDKIILGWIEAHKKEHKNG